MRVSSQRMIFLLYLFNSSQKRFLIKLSDLILILTASTNLNNGENTLFISSIYSTSVIDRALRQFTDVLGDFIYISLLYFRFNNFNLGLLLFFSIFWKIYLHASSISLERSPSMSNLFYCFNLYKYSYIYFSQISTYSSLILFQMKLILLERSMLTSGSVFKIFLRLSSRIYLIFGSSPFLEIE